MDVKEFFYSGGVVKCKDRIESDVVIDICRREGFDVFDEHDPYGDYHGAYYSKLYNHITFYRNHSSSWNSGTPYAEWIEEYRYGMCNPVCVEDLI